MRHSQELIRPDDGPGGCLTPLQSDGYAGRRADIRPLRRDHARKTVFSYVVAC